MLKISVLSGKGCAGKTFVSTNLANVIKNSTYIDMDVEEPNGLNYFKVKDIKEHLVKVKIPQIDYQKCTNCRNCVDACVYGGLMFISKPIVLENICHHCTKCTYVCKNGAIDLKEKTIGQVISAKTIDKDLNVVSGKMELLEASGVEIINAEKAFFSEINIIDSPPGTGCLTISSIIDSDYLLVVVEASEFGLHNLKMVIDLARELEKPFGIVINKSRNKANIIYNYAKKNHLIILETFAFDKELYQKNSNALLVSDETKYRAKFNHLKEQLWEQVL